jgi:PPK2 family polyphosphate:nucleotide phosphotransferase
MKIGRFVVGPEPKKLHLRRLSTGSTAGLHDQAEGERRLAEANARISALQEKLYAQDQWSVLLLFQAMDAAGKDSTIKAVMSGINPQGCQVFSFKVPSAEELDHDFMWRYLKRLPERGRIGIFNRSYYEELLVVRVHPELLEKQRLPAPCRDEVWKRRFEDINAIERYLTHNGVVVIKFFLNVSREVQLERFLKRLDKPNKNWKFSESDVSERVRWDDYMDAYEDVLRRTSTEHAPWYVIPADHKWYMRAAVAEVVAQRLEQLDLRFPEVSDQRRAQLRRIRAALARQK